MQGKRALSLEMIRRLNEHFGIPADVLIRSSRARRRRSAA
jgi:antitoxin component HigA of HigAB toxin-antitoxin module